MAPRSASGEPSWAAAFLNDLESHRLEFFCSALGRVIFKRAGNYSGRGPSKIESRCVVLRGVLVHGSFGKSRIARAEILTTAPVLATIGLVTLCVSPVLMGESMTCARMGAPALSVGVVHGALVQPSKLKYINANVMQALKIIFLVCEHAHRCHCNAIALWLLTGCLLRPPMHIPHVITRSNP